MASLLLKEIGPYRQTENSLIFLSEKTLPPHVRTEINSQILHNIRLPDHKRYNLSSNHFLQAPPGRQYSQPAGASAMCRPLPLK